LNKTSIGHDLKNSRRRKRGEFVFSKEFFTGLAAGLIVAVVVYIWQQQAIGAMQSGMMEKTLTTSPEQAVTEPETFDENVRAFDFPEVLPKREVVIVERDGNADASTLPSAPILRPGAYVLHLGIFGDSNQAEELKAKLLRVGLRPEIQNLTIDGEIQYRVRIGVINDIEELNRIRSLLQRSETEAEVVWVGE
jgi:cell division protein FtsN